MSGLAETLALKKQLLLLRLESHRLDIEADVRLLKHPMRHVAIGGSLVRLFRTHPILVTGTSALLARVPRLGLVVKLVAAGLAAWQVAKLIYAWRRD